MTPVFEDYVLQIDFIIYLNCQMHWRSFVAKCSPNDFGLLSCCLTSTEARWPIRDGDRVGWGQESERFDRGNRPKKTGETVDRRQNNGSVKAVFPRHCAAIALSTAVLDIVTKTMSVALLLTNNLDNSKQKKSNFRCPVHLPTHDLFWANLRVQLHLPPLTVYRPILRHTHY